MRAFAIVGALVAASLFGVPGEAAAAVACGGEIATIVGTDGNDVIVGTNGRDVIHALRGRDIVRGLDGDDVICTGPGRDRVFGGAGDDTIFGGISADRLRGGPGFDVIHGGPGDDVLRGSSEGDVLLGGPGIDFAQGGGAADVCRSAVDRDSCGEVPTAHPTTLAVNESLLPGQHLTVGEAALRVDASGNVALWVGGVDVWDTDSDGYPYARLTLAQDGSLGVVWRGRQVWASPTDRGAFAELRTNGNLVIKSAAQEVLWDRRSNPGMIDWHLPFPIGESWEAGAPHGENLSALDFGPARGVGEVVAVASGRVGWFECQSGGRYLEIDHGDGYSSTYYHLVNIRTELIGHWVEAGTVVGEAGNAVPCGGRSTFAHVHLTLWHEGVRMSADGLMIRGYSVHAGDDEYYGHWKDADTGQTILVNPGGAVCCLPNHG